MPGLELESILCSPRAFGLRTASPLQRAICRASDGLPLGKLWEHDEVRAAFAGVAPPHSAPETLVILAAIRCAKSMIAAAKAVQISQNVDLSLPYLSEGDEIRIPIVSVDKDKARVVFSHMIGQLKASQALRSLLVGEPTSESFWLRHPSGRAIEVCVTPLAKQGQALVARWLPAVIFDEAPLMAGVTDAKKNLTEALGAIAGRVLPGGQVLMIGSPWAPFGPVFDLVSAFWGKPSKEIVVVRAPGPAMNPVYWTPKRCEHLRLTNPVRHRTNVLAEFADVEDGIFATIELEAATRQGPPERAPIARHHYTAGMDPAFRGNAWTFVIVECTGTGGRMGLEPAYSVAVARQWIGSKTSPLKASTILQEIADLCKLYGIDGVYSDQHNVDTIGEFAGSQGISVSEIRIGSDNRLEMVERVHQILAEGRLELPPCRELIQDLKGARKRVTQNGVTLILPRSGDGRHCDYVPALALALAEPPDLPEPPDQPELDELERMRMRLNERNSGDHWAQVTRRISGR